MGKGRPLALESLGKAGVESRGQGEGGKVQVAGEKSLFLLNGKKLPEGNPKREKREGGKK